MDHTLFDRIWPCGAGDLRAGVRMKASAIERAVLFIRHQRAHLNALAGL